MKTVTFDVCTRLICAVQRKQLALMFGLGSLSRIQIQRHAAQQFKPLESANHCIDSLFGCKFFPQRLQESRLFGNGAHECDAPENVAYINATAKWACKSIAHDASVYRTWIAPRTSLPVGEWVEQQHLTEEELWVKQEEMDDDPLANIDTCNLSSGGLPDDPIDLTLED